MEFVDLLSPRPKRLVERAKLSACSRAGALTAVYLLLRLEGRMNDGTWNETLLPLARVLVLHHSREVRRQGRVIRKEVGPLGLVTGKSDAVAQT